MNKLLLACMIALAVVGLGAALFGSGTGFRMALGVAGICGVVGAISEIVRAKNKSL